MQVPALEKSCSIWALAKQRRIRRKSIRRLKISRPLLASVRLSPARNSIAGFKVRENMPLGVKVTLRGRMFEFVDRLVTIALPRVRDFRGLNPNSFDGNGNFAMGLKEHIVFPEINYDKVDTIWGMDIIVCTSTNEDDQARELLRGFNFPFTD